jgi:hypothetical protein
MARFVRSKAFRVNQFDTPYLPYWIWKKIFGKDTRKMALLSKVFNKAHWATMSDGIAICNIRKYSSHVYNNLYSTHYHFYDPLYEKYFMTNEWPILPCLSINGTLPSHESFRTINRAYSIEEVAIDYVADQSGSYYFIDYHNVNLLYIRNCIIPDEEFKWFTNVSHVTIRDSTVGDRGLQCLTGAKYLTISNLNITSEAIVGLKQLRYLWTTKCKNINLMALCPILGNLKRLDYRSDEYLFFSIHLALI